jgi:hypothetical protein
MVAIILVILFLLGVVYVRGSFITMFGNVYKLLRKGTASGLNYSKVFSPSFLVFLITSLLFGTIVMATMYPRTGNIFYRAYIDIVPQENTGGQEVHEGFVLEAPYDPNVREKVITKKDLLERLQSHLNRTTLPPGIQCDSNNKVSILAIEGYLKRIMLATSKKLSQEKFEEWASITHTIFSHTCTERKLILLILDKLHQDSRTGYSTNELRTLMNSLLKFYDSSRVNENRFRSREEVNQIVGIPIGERDPRNETALKGTNAFILKTSIHDTGGNPNAPTDYSDPFSYFSVENESEDTLSTQTNNLRTLDLISDKPMIRANTQTRGSNA